MSVAHRARAKAIRRGEYDFAALRERYRRQGRPLVHEKPHWQPPKRRRDA